MLRNYIKKLLPIKSYTYRNVGLIFIAVFVVFIASTKVTYAIGIPGINLWDVVTEITAYIVNTFLAIASWFVAITGMLLNVSITLTLHIKDFLASTPAIYTVWKTIRDITGLFIIFALLYAAVRMILGLDQKLGNVIKNIVVAGVLINFSFFVTALLIDVSNVVSLQLYKAITPGQPSVSQLLDKANGPGTELTAVVSGLMKDGGLSAVFMQSLQIQSAFHPNSYDLSGERGNVNMAPFRIVFIGITGIVIMITAGLSFLFAALAFVVRLILLLFLLAFSPIWCAAYVVPQLKEYAGEWTKTLIAQLTFMPAYLLLMYVALKIITGSQLFNSGAYGGLWKGMSGDLSGAPTEFITFAINAVFIIFMLNVPLLVAIKLGASTGKLLDGNKLGADVLWKGVGGIAGRNTIGRWSSSIDKQLANTRFGNSSLVRDIRASTTGAAAKAKFGSSRSFEDQAKINEDVAKQRELIRTGNTDADKKRKAGERSKRLEALIAAKSTVPTQYKDIIKSMNEKEKLALGGKNLKNIEVLKHLKKSDFEAIKKSDDISDEDKAEIGKLRMEALRHTVDQGISQADFTEHMIKEMDTSDIMKLENSYLEDPHLIAHLTAGQLKKMADEKLDPGVKRVIGDTIENWTTNPAVLPLTGGAPHHAYGYIHKNIAQWS